MNPVIAGEDAGHFIFFYDDGRRALFDGDRHIDHAAANRRRAFGDALIEGARATLRLDGDGRLWLRDHGENDEARIPFDAPETGFGGDCVFALQAHVVDHLRSGLPLENPAARYLDVMRLEQALYRSAEKGGKVTVSGLGRTTPPAAE